MSKYYCLIAGLPDVRLDDLKIPYSPQNFKHELQQELSAGDWKLIESYYDRYDNENIIKWISNKDSILNGLGNVTALNWEAYVTAIKEEENPSFKGLPNYLAQFLRDFYGGKFENQSMVWLSNYISGLYFAQALRSPNRFFSAWYAFNLNIINILTAINCRKFNLKIDENIVGDNEIAQLLRTNSSRDFGVSALFEQYDQLVRISETSDLLLREKQLDALRWNYLDDNTFFYYFAIENLFSYLLKIEILHRWTMLDKQSGEKIFRELAANMKGSFSFASEFNV